MNSTCPVSSRDQTRRRSRYGCRNCKLRKLKCDETKPTCKRCTSFGVLCNFVSNIPDLQPVAAGAATSLVARREPEIRRPVTNCIWIADELTSFQLNTKCQDFISRYLGRSLVTLTPDDPSMVHVNRKLLGLAFTYPCLMHASLAVAFAYDRYLNSPTTCRRSLEECYHFAQSTALLNKRLREPIKPVDKDPIWGTAAALAILSFSSPDACAPEESWPLKSSDSELDFDWLRLSNGKMSLWDTVNPLRPDSIFSIMAKTYAHMSSPLPASGIDGIPEALAMLCSLHDTSTAENNAYFDAVHALSQMLGVSVEDVTTGQTQLFTRCIHGTFEALLRRKDPTALLLLYMWYRKAGQAIWWIELRARVESPAIYLYLQRYHRGDAAIQAFLPGGIFADMMTV